MTDKKLVSNAFMTFLNEAPEHAEAWKQLGISLGNASALDPKTSQLAYLAVMASQRILSGIPFHVKSAKQAGATREEVISAILVGLPLAGNVVTQALPAAVEAFDSE